MIYRKPTGEDVADLLLLCAPQNILEELNLAEESKENFANHFNILESSVKNNMYKRDMTVLALYYCNINISNNMKFHRYMKAKHHDVRFDIAHEVLFNLVCVAKSEEFNDTNNLIQEMMSDVMNYQDEIIIKMKDALEKRENGPKAWAEQTEARWKLWDEEIKKYLMEGRAVALIIQLIGEHIEASGTWKEPSKKYKGKFVLKPDRGTIRSRVNNIKDRLIK